MDSNGWVRCGNRPAGYRRSSLRGRWPVAGGGGQHQGKESAMSGSPQAQHGTVRSSVGSPGRAGAVPRHGGTVTVELPAALADHGGDDVLLLEAGPADGLAHTHLPRPRATVTWRGPDGRPALPPGGQVRSGLGVLAVDVRNGQARGVLGCAPDGTVATVAAGTLVLCAGIVESTRSAAVALTGVGVLANARLGGLADHIVQGFIVRLPRRPTSPTRLARPADRPGTPLPPADGRARRQTGSSPARRTGQRRATPRRSDRDGVPTFHRAAPAGARPHRTDARRARDGRRTA